MGGTVAVSSALQQIQQNKPPQQHGAPTSNNQSSQSSQSSTQASTPSSTQQTTQQTVSPVELGSTLLAGIKTVGWRLLVMLLLVIGTRILYVLIKYALRYGYAFFNARRLIFLKILLPRADGKSDREQEKELAKDMKEKI